MIFSSNVVKMSHAIFKEFVGPGDTVVDATCGNGWDTLTLAYLLKGKGKLVSYDIQQQALDAARKLLEDNLSEAEREIITLKLASHEDLEEEGAKIIHYNLGYLPKGDKQITTVKETSLASIKKALTLVADNGVITIVCYPGHEEGKEETACIESFAEELDPRDWLVQHYYIMNRKKTPRLLVIRRQNS